MKAIITTSQKTSFGTEYTRTIYNNVIRIFHDSEFENTVTIVFETINGYERATYNIKDFQIDFEE